MRCRICASRRRFTSRGQGNSGPSRQGPTRDTWKAGLASVEIDLSRCLTLSPAAVAWTAVFALLARRAVETTVLLPVDSDSVSSLVEFRLADVLRNAGVPVAASSMSLRPSTEDVVLPLRQFESKRDAELLLDEVQLSSSWSGISGNLNPLAVEILGELMFNAAEHSESPIGGLTIVALSSEKTLHLVVADGGIGVRASLARNRTTALEVAVRHDWAALDRARQEHVTGTSDPGRGIGLTAVANEVERISGRRFLLHSGRGVLNVSADAGLGAYPGPIFPGTLAYVIIPTRPPRAQRSRR